ncbi:hypothetical protein [Thermoleptolyngbya sichuanensis]|nr:hypothetical protein [Thermoleptolyngbya sichuanensis]
MQGKTTGAGRRCGEPRYPSECDRPVQGKTTGFADALKDSLR